MKEYEIPLEFAVVEITNRCNLACPHCASDSGRERPDVLSFREFCDLFGELASLGCRRITMLGGEFLLHERWFELGMAVRDLGMDLQLITNGLAADRGIVERFVELTPQAVAVSVDGANADGYRAMRGIDGFDHCMWLLRELLAAGISPVAAITTFSSRNIGDFDLFAELFRDSGIVWQVQMVNRGGERFDDSLLLTAEQYRFFTSRVIECLTDCSNQLKIQLTDDFGYFPMDRRLAFLNGFPGCPAGSRLIGVRCNGDILPCLSLGGGEISGNIRNRSLTELWRDPESFPKFRHKEEYLTGFCRECVKSAECRAGCTAMALSSSGARGENYYCIRREEPQRIVSGFLN